jgi:hypothetical protein
MEAKLLELREPDKEEIDAYYLRERYESLEEKVPPRS